MWYGSSRFVSAMSIFLDVNLARYGRFVVSRCQGLRSKDGFAFRFTVKYGRSFRQFLLIFRGRRGFTNLFVRRIVRFASNSIVRLKDFFSSRYTAIRLVSSASSILFIREVANCSYGFALFRSTLFLSYFCGVGYRSYFSTSLTTGSRSITYTKDSVAIATAFIIVGSFGGLFASAASQCGMERRLLLLFDGSGLRSGLAYYARVMAALCGRSNVRFARTFDSFVF